MQHEHSLITTVDIANSPSVTVSFLVQGRQLPADHGYALYSALTEQLPVLHSATWLGVELIVSIRTSPHLRRGDADCFGFNTPQLAAEKLYLNSNTSQQAAKKFISGVPWQKGIIVLPTRGASFHLRIPADYYGYVLPLAGQRLNIKEHTVRLGIPTARPITAYPSLYARIVTIKKLNKPEPFLAAARRQLDALGITANLELPIDEQGHFHRYIIKIQGRSVIGFSLATHNLSDDDSLNLQSVGIGGYRTMGCGIFNPLVNPSEQKEQRGDLRCPH